MNFYVMVSDFTYDMLKAFIYFFNKNIGPEHHVTVVGFFNPPYELPNNFIFVSIGNTKRFTVKRCGRNLWLWSNCIGKYLKNNAKETFVLFWDEHLPIKSNNELLRKLYNEVKNNNASKAILDRHLNHGKFCLGVSNFKNGIYKISQKTMYRTTLFPSVWKREYFSKYVKPDMTAWEFETAGIARSRKEQNIIISPKHDDAVKSFNVYIKGGFDKKGFSKLDIPIEDKHIILKYK